MHTHEANKIARAVLRSGLNVAAKNIRKAILPSIAPRSPDKGIGTSVRRLPSGTVGKAGVGVGASQRKAVMATNRGRRKGVGVSARNLHWFAMGTADRYTGSVRIRTKSSSKRQATGNARRHTGRISKSKFGNFLRNFGPTEVQRKMEERFAVLIQRAATGGISGAAEIGGM
jgi:hypothetical protein